ncbi:MAG TPA: GTPase ObgE [Nitrospiria bacterium]
MFVDQVKIYVKAGDGGNGCVSFRREKYVPRGGPNGGNGGHGGDVILKANRQLRTLLDLKYQQHYRVGHAEHGRGKDQNGKNTPPLIISVPLGTVVLDAETRDIMADLTREGEEALVARGGRGGRGNASFTTSTNRAPRHAEEGGEGEERELILELKLLADVGLVGFPNAGKSTFISKVTRARPKVADYAFTTLAPNLGVVSLEGDREFIVADIPGLIEGAHSGKGLGIQFLRHIERNAFLLFMVDIGVSGPEDPVHSFEVLREELRAYQPGLLNKPFALALTKVDASGDESRLKKLTAYCKDKGYDFFPISSVTGDGISALVHFLGKQVDREALRA